MLAWFTGYVWTEAVPGKEKLRIQKYPDTCGRLAITKSSLILYLIDRAGKNNYEFQLSCSESEFEWKIPCTNLKIITIKEMGV